MSGSEQWRDPATGWWKRTEPPRGAAVGQTGTYAFIMCAGIAGLVDPPTTIATQVSAWMLVYWAALLTFGGAIGAVAVIPGYFFAERIAIAACGFGFAIMVLSLVFATLDGDFRHAGTAVAFAFLIGGLGWNMVVRWFRVRHGARDPERFSTYGKHRHRAAE